MEFGNFPVGTPEAGVHADLQSAQMRLRTHDAFVSFSAVPEIIGVDDETQALWFHG